MGNRLESLSGDLATLHSRALIHEYNTTNAALSFPSGYNCNCPGSCISVLRLPSPTDKILRKSIEVNTHFLFLYSWREHISTLIKSDNGGHVWYYLYSKTLCFSSFRRKYRQTSIFSKARQKSLVQDHPRLRVLSPLCSFNSSFSPLFYTCCIPPPPRPPLIFISDGVP